MRGAFFFMPVGVGSIMLYSGVGLFLVLSGWKKLASRHNEFLLTLFFLFTGVLTWVQLAHPGWLIINASYAVIYVWCDIAIEDQRRRLLYQEIEKNALAAREASAAKTIFLGNMSHDIRTPMNDTARRLFRRPEAGESSASRAQCGRKGSFAVLLQI